MAVNQKLRKSKIEPTPVMLMLLEVMKQRIIEKPEPAKHTKKEKAPAVTGAH